MILNDKLKDVKIIIKLLPKQLITMPVFLWTFPFSIFLPILISEAREGGAGVIATWLLIGFISHLAMLPFVIYGLKSKSLSEQILLTLCMGVVRGCVISLLPNLFGIQDWISLPARVANSAIAVFYWNQTGAIIVEYGKTFRSRVKEILNEIIEKKIVGIPAAAKASPHELTSIIGHLQEKIVATVGSSPTRDELKAASREIDFLISEYIKPLSKSRWRDGELIWVKTGFLSIIKRTLEAKRIPVVAIVLLTFPFAVVSQTNRIGFLGTLFVQSIWISITLIINLIVFRSTPEDNYLNQNKRFFALTLLVTYPVTFIAQYNFMGSGSESLTLMFEGYLISIVAEICIFLIGTLLVSLYDDQEFVFSFLRELIKKGELEQLLDRTRSGNADADFAQYLHAEVQSQLLACKLLLLKAAESDFDLFPPELTQQIIERMEKISQPYEKPAARIPTARIEELANSWSGLANIRHQLPSELAELHHYSDIASQLIEEAVVNSIRHGSAKDISIAAYRVGDSLEVLISDDGTLSEPSNSRGLGSVLFDTFTTSWSRERIGSLTVLKFVIDISHKETLR